MFKRLACHIYFIKKIWVKEKPNQGVVILEEKQRGSMGSLALLGSLPRLGLLFNFEVCWAWFWAQVILLDNALLLSGWAFSFLSFLFFFFYPIGSPIFFFSFLPCCPVGPSFFILSLLPGWAFFYSYYLGLIL